VGKTALCIALAYKAIRHGAEARFLSCTDLINQLTAVRREGTGRRRWAAACSRTCWSSTK